MKKSKEAAAKQKVYVFINVWEDRHGESGSDVRVFSTKKKLDEHFAEDVRSYIGIQGALGTTKTGREVIDHNEVSSIGYDSLTRNRSLRSVIQTALKERSLEINIDDSGTNAKWSLEEQEVL